jgi:hypothetical protein
MKKEKTIDMNLRKHVTCARAVVSHLIVIAIVNAKLQEWLFAYHGRNESVAKLKHVQHGQRRKIADEVHGLVEGGRRVRRSLGVVVGCRVAANGPKMTGVR